MGILGWLGEADGRSRGVLVTAAGRRPEGPHPLALPGLREYADRWGYRVHAADLPGGGLPRRVCQLVRGQLREHRVVLWLDPDVLLLRHDEDVAALLGPRSFQGLAVDPEKGPSGVPAVWVLRSCPAAVGLLDAHRAPALVPAGGHSRGTTWLPERWRADGEQGRPDRCVVRVPPAPPVQAQPVRAAPGQVTGPPGERTVTAPATASSPT